VPSTGYWFSLLLLFVLVFLAPTTSAQPAPYHRYLTLETAHFNVHVPKGLEREGRVAGAYAERAYSLIARDLKEPRGRIDLVVTDDADYSNGYATPVPTNRIVIFATPPVANESLRLNEDWLQLVLTHELTHIFHLDRTRGLWSLAQHIFGRGPALFPNLYGPAWLTEGLAVYYESKLTEGGRLKDSEHRLLAQTAAAEHRLPNLNELSLGTPVFPGGVRAYAFGSLFVDYLASVYGDTSLRHFVDAQSAFILPFALDAEARRSFGISFHDAFEKWRDSVQKSVSDYRPPLAGWRELTTHGYAALDPRWVDDTTLVYASNDGRSSPALYRVDLAGNRHRISRRNSLGASVPWPGGGLLFAQLDFTSPYELRTDLYVERGGRQQRLTSGLRLSQPDVRNDGTIIAVQFAPTRASLMLLDSTTTQRRYLRDAESDETWSEPRWSPDGRFIAAIHRQHGGVFTLEVIDVASSVAEVLDRAASILSSPSWSLDGAFVIYTSEVTGTPALARGRAHPTAREASVAREGGAENMYTPEYSPRGDRLAAVTLRADGFHVGMAPASTLTFPGTAAARADTLRVPQPQPLAAGDYHAYHAWRSVLPTYWYPVVEQAPGRGVRLGASTAGHDVVYRHLYDGFVALPTTGSFPTGRFTYRYAGFRQPLIDLNLSQDFTGEFDLFNGGTAERLGTLLRRTQSASLATTFTRPRVRTSSSMSVGAAVEHRNFFSDPDQFLKQLDSAFSRGYVFPSVFVATGWSNLQRPTLSISPEDGISVSLTARERWRSDIPGTSRSASLIGVTSLYKSLDFPGFAHHVVALRVAGGIADSRSASAFQVGGVSGTTIQILPGYVIGEGRRTFGVRGFPAGSVYGNRALTGTFEYRLPLALPAAGIGSLPFFLDRSSVSFFADAGVATCSDSTYVRNLCAPTGVIGKTIGAVGAELVQSAAVLDYDTPQNIRVGFGLPVVGRAGGARGSVYLAYGLSF